MNTSFNRRTAQFGEISAINNAPVSSHQNSSQVLNRQRRRAVAQRMRSGFTLLQILIVLAIIGVLAAIMFSVMGRERAAARRAQCDAHLKNLAISLNEFRAETGRYPSSLVALRTKKYLSNGADLHCPADPNENGTYGEYYAIRAVRDSNVRPLIVCPFHEGDGNYGMQAFKDPQTSQNHTMKASLKGANDTTVERPGQKPIAARAGMEVRGGDLIRTGSGGSASILFADGSSSELGASSTVTVMQSFASGQSGAPLYTLVRQKVGNVLYKVNPGSHFDVVTPTATAGALGTEFRIQTDALGTGFLTVIKHRVYLSTLKENKTFLQGAKHPIKGLKDSPDDDDSGKGNDN